MPSREYYVDGPDSEYIESYLRFMISVAILLGATIFCNLQSRARTHAVLVIGLYELLGNPTT
jgi:hypothetical protein